MKFVYQIAAAYVLAQIKISEMIEKSNLPVRWIAKEVGISQAMFYRRLKYREWEPGQIEKIALLLDPDAQLTIGGAE